MSTTETTIPTPRVSKITIGRLHNMGNYEHVRYEVTVEVPEGASAAAVMADLEGVLADLKPKPPVEEYDLARAIDTLKKPVSELQDYEISNIPALKEKVAKDAAWRKSQIAARVHLDAIGGAVSYVDAKETWDNQD